MPKKVPKDEPKEPTRDDIVDALLAPNREAMSAEGMDLSYLLKKLKREMNAKETKVFKGASKDFEDGKLTETYEEAIYSKPLIAWDVRQKARQDAHKLRGDYPSEKVDHKVGFVQPLTIESLSPEDKALHIKALEAITQLLIKNERQNKQQSTGPGNPEGD